MEPGFWQGTVEMAMENEAEKLFSRRAGIAAVALVAVFAGLLWLEGRPGWCKYGFGFWSAAWTHCTSQNLADPYSLTHFLHGVLFFWMLRPLAGRIGLPWRLVAALVLEIGWELLENSPWVIEKYRQDTASLDYTGDSIVNSLGDVAATMLGFAFASRVNWKVALVVLVVVEVGLVFFIRDSLTLNVVMLFWSPEAVKAWQLGG